MTPSHRIKELREVIANWCKRAEDAEAELAAIKGEQQPVAFTQEDEISNMHTTGLYLRAWPAVRKQNSVEGYTIPLYTHPAPEVLPTRNQLRELVDAVWNEATESNAVPGTKDADNIIDKVFTVSPEPIESRYELGTSPLPVIEPDALTEIMQNAWNEWCDDTGCFPDDFELRGKLISFDAGRWARLVAERIIRAAGLEVKL